MTLKEIIENWTDTDKILYKTYEIKFKALEEAKKRIIAKE